MNEFEFRVSMRMLDIVERVMLRKGKETSVTEPEPTLAKKPDDAFYVESRVDEDLFDAMNGIIGDEGNE